MKHSFRITATLLIMFFLTQLIGLFVINQYSAKIDPITNQTTYNIPYGMEPPQDITPNTTLISIIFAIIIAVFLMFILMSFKSEIILRIWFFIVVSLALGITFNSFILNTIQNSSLIAIALALPLAFIKIFKRNILIHNITELAIYPGIAAIFVPLLSIWTVAALLIIISLYDMYAVWHSGIMQKMAKYQIKKLKFFTGFFVPYIGKKERLKLKKSTSEKPVKVKVNLAILGGGDVVFPLILAGVVLTTLGLLQAVIISLGATLALAGLFYMSQKGKFYPAMPFITLGCFIALAIAYLI